MLQILRTTFRDELKNKTLPIKKDKHEKCRQIFIKSRESAVSVSSINATLHNIRNGKRKLTMNS